MQVYPAASLMHYVQPDTNIFYIDPKPAIENIGRVIVITKPATLGVQEFIDTISR